MQVKKSNVDIKYHNPMPQNFLFGKSIYPCMRAPKNASAAPAATIGSAVEPRPPPVLVAVTNVVLPDEPVAVTSDAEAVAVAVASTAAAVLLYTIDVYPLTVMGTLVLQVRAHEVLQKGKHDGYAPPTQQSGPSSPSMLMIPGQHTLSEPMATWGSLPSGHLPCILVSMRRKEKEWRVGYGRRGWSRRGGKGRERG